MNCSLPARKSNRGFSLAEIVLALGIVSISLLAIFAVFAGTMQSSGNLSDRRVLVESVDALRGYLNDSAGFDQVFGWVSGDATKELIYVTYRSDSTGAPSAEGEETRSIWVEPSAADQYDTARNGKWVKAWLEYAPSANAADTLTGSADDFEQAVMVVRAEMAAVGTTAVTQPSTPDFTSHVAVRR